MTRIRLLTLLAVALALGATGCAGGSDAEESVPSDAVAVVAGEEVPKTQFDDILAQAKASYKSQKRPFPKAGTPEYNAIKNQALQFLVQREQFEQKAEELDVEVTDTAVDKRLARLKKQYFAGNQKRYLDQLKQQGLTETQVKRDVRAQLVQEGIYNKVTKDVKVTDVDIAAYYAKNQQQYRTPESRDVRHILVKGKAQADKLYGRIKGGENFEKLAKEFSQDPGSKAQGGKLTITRGQTVPPFDKTAFKLAKNTLSRPVKTQYGYHLIEPLSAVKGAKTTPLKAVKATISQQLVNTKKSERMTKWVEDSRKEFAKETRYQVGFTPPPTVTTGTTGTTGTTTTG